jgi:hypothetical protein
MPIQIRELIVTATVDEQKVSGTSPKTPGTAASQEKAMKEEIIQACVDEVLKVIKQQTRR